MHIMKCLKYMEEQFVEVYINKFIQHHNYIFGYCSSQDMIFNKVCGSGQNDFYESQVSNKVFVLSSNLASQCRYLYCVLTVSSPS